MFHFGGVGWREVEVLIADDGGAQDQLGWAVASDDGVTMCGAPFWDAATTDARGAVYGSDVDFTALSACSCPLDASGDGVVSVSDLLIVLADWGCSGACEGDVTGDGAVDVSDLLAITGAWGDYCLDGCSLPPVSSLCDELEDAGLDCEDASEVIDDAIESEDGEVIANMACWLEHYLLHCNPLCTHPASCPDDDPFE